MRNRRRKAVTLLEELSLRTSKVIPLMKKLQSICNKMNDLSGRLKEKNSRLSEDDRAAMGEEFEGLMDLVLENPEGLTRPLVEPSSLCSMNTRMPNASSPEATCGWWCLSPRNTAIAA